MPFGEQLPHWYDFNWYVKQRVQPNLPHREAALIQYGPWQGQAIHVDTKWASSALMDKIASMDWKAAARDVERFLNASERQSLALWSEKFFRSKVDQLFQDNA